MLHRIKTINDCLISLIKDDPVRPELSAEFRVNETSEIFVLQDDETEEPLAVTCVKFLNGIPRCVEDLAEVAVHTNTAVFYTIWSYSKGAGQRLIQAAREDIEQTQPEVDCFVTLSPKTEMAERFHLKNGAEKWRVNEDTVNYLYP